MFPPDSMGEKMKTIISILVALFSMQALANLQLTADQAQTIIDDIQWEKLGQRSYYNMGNIHVECMTLSNYDDNVDFDCIIKNDFSEVVLDKRELAWISNIPNKKLSKSGLKTRNERSEMHCFQCSSTRAISAPIKTQLPFAFTAIK